MARVDTLTNFLTDVASAIKQKKGDSTNILASDFDTEIINLPSGSSEVIKENDVNFWDYDGTLVMSYSKEDFLQLSSLPDNPSHDGLVAQGWNWTLAGAKSYVEKSKKLNIGQNYTTASGLTEIDVEVTPKTGLVVQCSINGNKDWGDGTSDTYSSHTYENYGSYTIKVDATSISGSSVFGGSASGYEYRVKRIRIANAITSIGANTITGCKSLMSVSVPTSITFFGSSCFRDDSMLKAIVFPSGANVISYAFNNCYNLSLASLPETYNHTYLYDYMFQYCYNLKHINIPSGITRINGSVFEKCLTLEEIFIPNTVTTIKNYAFYSNYGLTLIDFSSHTSVPTIDANALGNYSNNSNNATLKIVVPDSLYDTWITATNWSNYADYIVKASEV